eukprot:699313-Karenia_brevis.AAC.1
MRSSDGAVFLHCFVPVSSIFGRKEWEEKVAKMRSSFAINKAVMKRNEDALRRARSLHDVLMNKSPSNAYEKGAGKGKQKGGGKSSEKEGSKSS